MTPTESAAARRHMVDSQLKPNKVTDAAVIAVLGQMPRERFVPTPMQGVAYLDADIAVGRGRYLMEPMVFARLLQAAEIQASDKALMVGDATGYGAAVVARLAAKVVALESDKTFADHAYAALSELGCRNAVVVEGPLAAGAPAEAPFDLIVLEGAVEQVPATLVAQLATGGRLVGVKRHGGTSKAFLLRRLENDLSAERPLFDAATPLLPGFAVTAGFVF